MSPSVRTLQGSKIKSFKGSSSLCPRGSNSRGFSNRNPSRPRIEEHDMLNWVKANRKALNAGKLKPERVEAFKRLLAISEQYRRVNQWE